MRRSQRYAAACGGEGEYDFTPIYDDIADYIRLSDASIVNFEAVISESGDYDYFPKYIVPPTAIDALTGIGFNIIDLSNDHMLDGGVEGVLATESYVRKCGALPLAEYADRSDLEKYQNSRHRRYTCRARLLRRQNKRLQQRRKRHLCSVRQYSGHEDTDENSKAEGRCDHSRDALGHRERTRSRR